MATQVTLFHNPTSGVLQHSEKDILKTLRKKGFVTTYVDIKADDFSQHLENPGELIVVAGGDGTVKKISKHVVGKGVPIGLLPLGTANNIATSLGIFGEPGAIIKSWNLSLKKPYDVGLVKGPHGEKFFFESVGFGPLTQLMKQHPKIKSNKRSREEGLKEAYRHLKRIVKDSKSHPCTIWADGQHFSGNFILMEITNVPFIGPNLKLAPNADPEDGLLDVVFVEEEEREEF